MILAENTPVDIVLLNNIFAKEDFRFRFRNYVPTQNGEEHSLITISSTRLTELKSSFAERGYYVGDEATPTATENKYSLASNVTRTKMMLAEGKAIGLKQQAISRQLSSHDPEAK